MMLTASVLPFMIIAIFFKREVSIILPWTLAVASEIPYCPTLTIKTIFLEKILFFCNSDFILLPWLFRTEFIRLRQRGSSANSENFTKLDLVYRLKMYLKYPYPKTSKRKIEISNTIKFHTLKQTCVSKNTI